MEWHLPVLENDPGGMTEFFQWKRKNVIAIIPLLLASLRDAARQTGKTGGVAAAQPPAKG